MKDTEVEQTKGGKTIKGEVLRVEGNDCLIKGRTAKRCEYIST